MSREEIPSALSETRLRFQQFTSAELLAELYARANVMVVAYEERLPTKENPHGIYNHTNIAHKDNVPIHQVMGMVQELHILAKSNLKGYMLAKRKAVDELNKEKALDMDNIRMRCLVSGCVQEAMWAVALDNNECTYMCNIHRLTFPYVDCTYWHWKKDMPVEVAKKLAQQYPFP